VLWPPIGRRYQIAHEVRPTTLWLPSIRSRNTDIDREADELAAAVADLNEELERLDGRDSR
jgi:hypothetical protein